MNVETYILHCKELKERREFMETQLTRHGFDNVTWYTDHDAKDQNGQDLTGIYNGLDPELYTKKISIGGWNPGEFFPRHLRPGEISLSTKWGNVLLEMSKSNQDYCIGLEDDAFLCEDFVELFYKYMDNTPSDWDVIYMGSCCNLHAKYVDGQHAYLASHPASRCTDSIVFKKDAAARLASEYFPFDFPSDFQLGYLQSKLNLNVYWWEPTLVKQGSESGTFKSSLGNFA